MKNQPHHLDTRFEQFAQELTADYQAQAYEFKAFARACKIQSPLQLLQLVMLYYGLDFSLRSCAGEVAHFQGYLSDTALKKRLAACVPWVKSLLSGVFGFQNVIDKGALSFVVMDLGFNIRSGRVAQHRNRCWTLSSTLAGGVGDQTAEKPAGD